jgi:hypothetical protein
MNKLFFISLLVYLFICLFSPKASAATMTNDSYSVQKRTVQIQPYTTEAPKPKTITVKPYAQGDNFIVQTTNPDPFSFSVSQNILDFGVLQATNPVIRKLTFTLASNRGYHVLTAADHPLQNFTNQTIETIPDTTCDNGSCSDITEALWTNTLTYGFGYHTDSMDAATFRQFPNTLQNEAPATLVSASYAKDREFNITYKINISNTQSKGAYTNKIMYIATPDF